MLSAVSFDMELQKDNEHKWELAMQLLDKINLTNLTNAINYKYGWQRGDDVEDTKQDMILITFNAIANYERKMGRIYLKLSDMTDEDISFIKKSIIGRYRYNVWENRIDKNMRMSDVYNIQHSSEDDVHLYFTNMSENDIIDNSTIHNQDDDNEKYTNELRTIICRNLISILKPELSQMIDANIFGHEFHGLLNHSEIAKNTSKCRSAVTRRINRGIKFLYKFIQDNNISLQQINRPTKEDYDLITNLIKEYKNKNLYKTEKIKSKTPILNIEYFLKQKECYIVTNKYKISSNTVLKSKKRSKRLTNISIQIHNIEEYLC